MPGDSGCGLTNTPIVTGAEAYARQPKLFSAAGVINLVWDYSTGAGTGVGIRLGQLTTAGALLGIAVIANLLKVVKEPSYAAGGKGDASNIKLNIKTIEKKQSPTAKIAKALGVLSEPKRQAGKQAK